MDQQSAFPETIKVETLDVKHPDYTTWHKAWEDYEILHAGGERIRKEAARFLNKRAKEPRDVWNARLKRFTYTPVVGTILGWYISKMFRRDPEIDLIVNSGAGEPTEQPLSTEQKAYFDKFLENTDRRGRTFIDVMRDVFRDLMLYRRAYVLMDLPASNPTEFKTLKDQLDAGVLDPYLTVWKPGSVINWSDGPDGNLEWAVLYVATEKRSLLGSVECIDRWTIVDRESIALYERRYAAGAQEKPKEAHLIFGPTPHVLAGQNRVPLYRVEIPDALWITDRISLLARNHLNTENGLDWALESNNVAMPIITGRVDEKQFQTTEIGAWHFPDEKTTVSYLEHSGNSFVISSSRLEGIREEAYRVAYLMDQGRSSAATPAAQSGLSKQADKEPANEVLNAFGDILRALMQLVLGDAAKVRDFKQISADVRGLTFDNDDPGIEITNTTAARELNIPSDTLDKELMKKVARLLLPDANQTLVAKVMAEIDGAGSREDREADAMQREQDILATGMEAKFKAKAKAGK